MITWFQRVFGKHLKWVLMLVLIVLLVSFIVTMGAVPRANFNAQRHEPLMVFGRDLRDATQMDPIKRATQYTLVELIGQPNISNEQYTVLLLARMAMMQLADQWGLPEATPKQIDEYLRTVPRFLNSDGTFNNAEYLRYRDEVDATPTDTRNQIMTVLTENARLEQVHKILGGPGYAPAYAAESQMLLGQVQYNLELATADFTSFEPKITVDPAAIEQMFARNPQAFPIPATARLSYLLFPAPKVGDPTPEQLREFATAHKEQFPGVTPDNLGDQADAVAKAWREAQNQEAMKQAQAASMKFVRELYDLGVPRGDPAIAALLKKDNLTPLPLPTITQGKPVPADSPVPNDALQQIAFAMSDKTYYTPPVRVPDGAAVLFYEDSTPARAAKLDEVRDEVVKAYEQQEKERQFVAHGTEMHDAIVKAMAEGKTFAEAATAQGLTVKGYPDVTYKGLSEAVMNAYASAQMPAADKDKADAGLAGLSTDTLSALVQPNSRRVPFLFTLQPGNVTPMIPIPDHGIFVYAVKREVPKSAGATAELQQSLRLWGKQEADANAGFAVGQLVSPAEDIIRLANAAQNAQ